MGMIFPFQVMAVCVLRKRQGKLIQTKLKKKFFDRYDKGKEDVYFDAKKSLKFGICDQIVDKTNWRDALLEQIKEDKAQEEALLEELSDE